MVFSGIAQWIVLRKVIPNASRWLYVHLGVGIISLTLFLFRGSLNSGGSLFVAGHLATSLSWGVYIAATATVLHYLFGKLPEELTPPSPNFLLSLKTLLLRPTLPFAVRTGRSLVPASQSTSINSNQNQASTRFKSWDERLIDGAEKLIALVIAAITNVLS
ncbi:hypothetical protein NIES208_01020 [[Limnothrix rosea] IAM M-220]|nr:hypothetical protein NIES208_01020 [[Limnothrix rosea] IAM M-220]